VFSLTGFERVEGVEYAPSLLVQDVGCTSHCQRAPSIGPFARVRSRLC